MVPTNQPHMHHALQFDWGLVMKENLACVKTGLDLDNGRADNPFWVFGGVQALDQLCSDQVSSGSCLQGCCMDVEPMPACRMPVGCTRPCFSKVPDGTQLWLMMVRSEATARKL